LTRAVENTKETSLGLGKMEFWSDSIEKIFQVQKFKIKVNFFKDKPIKEPVAISLHHACKNNPLPKNLFTQLINAKV